MSPSHAIRLPLIMLIGAQPNTFPPREVVSASTINALIGLPELRRSPPYIICLLIT